MKGKNITLLVATCFILLAFSPLIASAEKNIQTATIYVDDDNTSGPWDGTLENPFQQIQQGIDNASSGDTIYVNDGIYYENVLVEKTVVLMGSNRNSTIIDADFNGTGILIRADGVEIIGFTIQNSGDVYWNSGIEIKSDDCKIDQNNIRFNRQGIVIDYHHPRNVISNNNISENWLNASYSAAGIHCKNSWNTIVCNNTIFNNSGPGIDFIGSNNIVFCSNIVKNNEGSGVRYTNCRGGDFKNNLFLNNSKHGLEFTCAWNECDLITQNSFISNANCGLYFCDNGCQNISENNFIDNGKNAHFSYVDFHEQKVYPCNWHNNYWDDWIGFGPKIIWGKMKKYGPENHLFKYPWPNFDWHPADEPFDITNGR